MYSKENKVYTGLSGVENYIKDNDVYNSKLLLLMSDPSVEREKFTILKHQYRPDLIAKDFYGDESYEGLLLIQSALSLSDYYEGAVLELIPKKTLDSILNSI